MTTEVHRSEYFDEFLDEEYSVKVANMEFRPSDILHHFAPDQYRMALVEYQETDWPIRLASIVEEYFPRPIAYHFQRYTDETLSAHQRLAHLKDSWEGLLSILFALVFGECVTSRSVIRNHAINLGELFSDRIGVRIQLIEHVVRRPDLIDPEPFFIRYVNQEVLNKIRELNTEHRNAWAHGQTLSESQIEEEFSEIEPKFMKLMEMTLFLKDCRLLRYLRSGERADQIVFESFVGSSLKPPNIKLSVPTEMVAAMGSLLRRNRLVCFTRQHLTGLAPFAHFEEDENGHITRFLMFRCKGRRSHSGQYQYSAIAGRRAHYISTSEFDDELQCLRESLAASRAAESESGPDASGERG